MLLSISGNRRHRGGGYLLPLRGSEINIHSGGQVSRPGRACTGDSSRPAFPARFCTHRKMNGPSLKPGRVVLMKNLSQGKTKGKLWLCCGFFCFCFLIFPSLECTLKVGAAHPSFVKSAELVSRNFLELPEGGSRRECEWGAVCLRRAGTWLHPL